MMHHQLTAAGWVHMPHHIICPHAMPRQHLVASCYMAATISHRNSGACRPVSSPSAGTPQHHVRQYHHPWTAPSAPRAMPAAAAMLFPIDTTPCTSAITPAASRAAAARRADRLAPHAALSGVQPAASSIEEEWEEEEGAEQNNGYQTAAGTGAAGSVCAPAGYAPASPSAVPDGPTQRLPVPLAPGCVRGTFAFWHDEKRFKGTGERSLAQRTLMALGGLRVGGNHKTDPNKGHMGWERLGEWDVLWTPALTGRKAAQQGLSPGQLVSAIPGSVAMTRKVELSKTLTQAYGRDAFTLITPLTFELTTGSRFKEWIDYLKQATLAAQTGSPGKPTQPTPAVSPQPGGVSSSRSSGIAASPAAHTVTSAEDSRGDATQRLAAAASELPPVLADRLIAAAAAGGGSGGAAAQASAGAGAMWILKTSQHLGKGVSIVGTRQAIKEVVARQQAVQAATTKEDKKAVRPFVVAQRYMSDPLLIQGRKFGVRLWVVVTSVEPLRAHLHHHGLVLFSSHAYDAATTTDMQAHLTNYAQNMHGDVWSLEQLRQHLGDAAYARLHDQMAHIAALTIAAAAPPMRKACAAAKVPHGAVFELFGLDFLVDSALQPWVLEVNSTPSLAVEHSQPEVQQMIYDQKKTMVGDMFNLVRVPARFLQPRAAQPANSGGSSSGSGRAVGSEHSGGLFAGMTKAAVAASLNLDVLSAEEELGVSGGGSTADLAALCAREARQVEAVRAAIMAAVPDAFYDPQLLQVLVDTEVEAQAAAASRFTPLMPLVSSQQAARQLGWSVPQSKLDTAVRQWYAQRQQLRARGTVPQVDSTQGPPSLPLYR